MSLQSPGTQNVNARTTRAAKSRTLSRVMFRVVRNSALGSVAYCVAVCVMAWCVMAWCMPIVPFLSNPQHSRLAHAEQSLRRIPAHISEFNPLSAPLALPRCGSVRPPEALLTPDPLLAGADADIAVRVDFIVGSDGRVHSAFVLNGAGSGSSEDEAVLRAVRQWRYRPALCNGVPTDSEARVRFSLH